MPQPLSAGKIMAIEISTRTTSVFSVLGSTFIITTFLWFPFFRKPINRLVFYATWGNLLANVATLMSTSAIPKDPTQRSSLCEFQGVLIQWFMMADSLWVLCMATNVFLVFFYGYDSRQLHHLEKWYLIFAYGIPAIPPIAYVILDQTGHRIIGPATLWCWVAKEVDWMRISFFYAPVWIVVTATFTIYIVTGLKIYKKRSMLRSFSKQPRQPPTVDEAEPDEITVSPFAGIVVTTQIQHDIQGDSIAESGSRDVDDESIGSFSSTRNLSNPIDMEHATASTAPSAPAILTQEEQRSTEAQDGQDSRNGYKATAFAANGRPRSGGPPLRTRGAEGNAAAMAYFRVAFLMFIALFVVWVPSTINRLYQFVHKDQPSYGLNIISAIVLPLQGFWNAMIYLFTTRAECRRAWGLIVAKFTGKAPQYQPPSDIYRKDTMTSSRDTRGSDAEFALDEILKQGGQVRSSEIPRSDSVADTKPCH